MIRTLNHITHRTGAGGPRHDPYGWTEWSITRKNGTVTWRICSLGYARVTITTIDPPGKVSHEYNGDDEIDRGLDLFEKLAGCTLRRLGKSYFRKFLRCLKCGSKNVSEEPGYPETLVVCNHCRNVQVGHVNEGSTR